MSCEISLKDVLDRGCRVLRGFGISKYGNEGFLSLSISPSLPHTHTQKEV